MSKILRRPMFRGGGKFPVMEMVFLQGSRTVMKKEAQFNQDKILFMVD
tara:strand:+ start:364 stop:507 length:144 start_codon:yes stop_codon:yes gene_type:complete